MFCYNIMSISIMFYLNVNAITRLKERYVIAGIPFII